MEGSTSEEDKLPPQKHVRSIFKEYTTPSRVLRSFTNLANTVIQTALSGQSKFAFEILQNADDAFEDQHKAIEVQFALEGDFFVVHHNGKGFDFNDVERICDYASQIEEVKASDLRKTGYKGLGFKSLFNLSECIYIHSNGYSFRFDKTFFEDAENRPWQVIPIWCADGDLPLRDRYPSYSRQPVNFILKVENRGRLEDQLREILEQPELLLYLNRIEKLSVDFGSGEVHSLERRKVKNTLEAFDRIDFLKDQQVVSTWLSRTYKRAVDREVQASVGGGSRFVFPDKIKNAKNARFTFALRCDDTLTEVSETKGLCFCTLPTQLHLGTPYHINGLFILNLDRTQLHENEWNEFLLYQLGVLQLSLLKDLAELRSLRNHVIELFIREIEHPYSIFRRAFLKGFELAKGKVGWIPSYQGQRLLKLGDAWTDGIHFFKQNFQNIRDHMIYPRLIDYDVKQQHLLNGNGEEAYHFTMDTLLKKFSTFYYPQLNRSGYISFIAYLHEKSNGNTRWMNKLKSTSFLRAKDGSLLNPKSALLEESESPVPDCLMLNPIDNEFLPSKDVGAIKDWLARLGARRLNTVAQVIRESILKWTDDSLEHKMTSQHHTDIMHYLAQGTDHLNNKEVDYLKKKLPIRTESGKFKRAASCYFPDAVSIKEFADIISDDDKISSSYDMDCVRDFFKRVGVHQKLSPIEELRKGVLTWIKNGDIKKRLSKDNYKIIVESVAEKYLSVESGLLPQEKTDFKQMLVLTGGQQFQKAQDCYFDSAIPSINGLQDIISVSKLVLSNMMSKNVLKFFTKIGVRENITPLEVVRKGVLKWIYEKQVGSRITKDNHQDILEYIAYHWYDLGLKNKEVNDLKRIPILTKNNTFREAYQCFFPSNPDAKFYEEIPMIESIISSDEFVSPIYSKAIKNLLEDLGVHWVTFVDVCEKYCDHLTNRENVKWFFSKLVDYWNKYQKDNLLRIVQEKLAFSRLLARNGGMYSAPELYSAQFDSIHDKNTNRIIPLLDYGKLPCEMEKCLGFKMFLDLKCITLLNCAVGGNSELGPEKTLLFWRTILEQLRPKDKHEIKKYQLKLLAQDNKLKPSVNLYYFIEEHATCHLDSLYLKRIHNMSHSETLELAELCGVHTLPYSYDIIPELATRDDTLKGFYLERLPFMVLQESRWLNAPHSITLKRLYDEVCTLELFRCHSLYVKYPFGCPTKIKNELVRLTLYVVGRWANCKSKIHKHLRKELGLQTNTEDITDMESVTSSEKDEWLEARTLEEKRIFYSIEAELRNLMNKEKLPSVEKADVVQAPTGNSPGEYIKEEELSADDYPPDENSFDSVEDENETSEDDDNPTFSVPGLVKSEDDTTSESSTGSANTDNTIGVNNFLIEVELKQKLGLEENLSPRNSDATAIGKALLKDKLTIEVSRKIKHSSDESSSDSDEDSVEDPQIRRTVTEKGIGVVGTFLGTKNTSSGLITGADSLVDPIGSIQREWEIKSNKLLLLNIPGDEFIEHFPPLPSQVVSSGTVQMKWKSEDFVFNFLQNWYKNKYPNSKFVSTAGVFEVSDCGRRPSKIRIVWLNANVESGKPYDLLIEKDGVITQIIEVHSSSVVANGDSFTINHHKFLDKFKQLEADFPLHKEKFCIYHAFHETNSSDSLALYKVVPLTLP